MSLKRGLNRLTEGGRLSGSTGAAGSVSTGRSSNPSEDTALAGPDSKLLRLPGSVQMMSSGPLRVIESYYGESEYYGEVAVDEMLGIHPRVWAALSLDPVFAEVDFRRALFLDTETTGLAGGVGTLPFLTGLSRFEDGQFVLEQLFVENYGLETPALEYLRDRLEQSSCVVTFNGKSFDWPLLRTRFVMNRMEAPVPPPHFDILHCARRILKRRMKSVRLTALERRLLRVERVGDVDGSEIPDIYFDYLHTGRPGQLLEVIRHNEWDLLAMPTVMGWLGTQYDRLDRNGHPSDWVGVAAVAERSGDMEKHIHFLGAAIGQASIPEAKAEAHLMLARIDGRNGQYISEVEHLKAVLLTGVKGFSASAHLRLAMVYEHKLKDFQKALHHAQHCDVEEGYTAADKRRRRLEERLDRCT